jgi:hypothetical protein
MTVRRDSDLSDGVLVSRWHQRLAVALDGPLEQLDPGADRIGAVVTAYLDTSRATTARPHPGRLFLSVLTEDLHALGAVDAGLAAVDLLAELDAVVALEDAAGRVLPAERAALLPTVVPTVGPARAACPVRWFARHRRLAATA